MAWEIRSFNLLAISALLFLPTICRAQTEMIELFERDDDATPEQRQRLINLNRNTLMRLVTVDLNAGKYKLDDALSILGWQSNATLVAHTRKFRAEFGVDIETVTVLLPPMKSVPLHYALNSVLLQNGANYEIRPLCIMIVPCRSKGMRIWRQLGPGSAATTWNPSAWKLMANPNVREWNRNTDDADPKRCAGSESP
jgi:hypothetical protein